LLNLKNLMKVELISIGDELLLGQTVNTNAAWLGKNLSLIGVDVVRVNTISDTSFSILKALNEVHNDASCVIITGGLGPTKDDITKQVLCEFFNTELYIHEPTLIRVTSHFKSLGKSMLEMNRLQASVPKNCEVLNNNYGTASGMWFEKFNKVFISLPGVPYEMKGIFKDEILHRIKKRFNLSSIYHKTILTQGIGESFLAEMLTEWEEKIRKKGFGLAYLPSPGVVKLRITSKNGEKDKELIDQYFQEIENMIPESAFGYGETTLPHVVGDILTKQKKTLGTVESCTSGILANKITSVPGASAYFMGSLLTYSNQLKRSLVSVSEKDLKTKGAVSKEVAIQMAFKGREILNVDYCISTTGIAGPGGATDTKPVGLVWIGLATRNGVSAKKFNFGDNRQRNMLRTTWSALNWLRYLIKSEL